MNSKIKIGDTVTSDLESIAGKTFHVSGYSVKFKGFYCDCLESKVKHLIPEKNLIKI